MVLSAALPYLTSVANGAMWARFVDQTVDRSTSCLRNDSIAQVVLHQVALIGLNFCFLNHLGYVSLASPLVGGLCLVPIFWVAICWGQQIGQVCTEKGCSWLEAFGPAQEQSVIRVRIGLEMIMLANTCMSIAAAALFALSGYLVFATVFGSLLVVSQLRRMDKLSFSLSWGSESFEFVVSNIAAVLIGAWYHRLRAVLDVSLRLRDYYKLSIRTEPIIPKVKPYTELSSRKIDALMGVSKEGKNLVATAEHLDWPGIELPDELPEGLQLDEYSRLAERVCKPEHAQAMRSGLELFDDHFRTHCCTEDYASDESVASYVLSKLQPWLGAVKKGNSAFPDQTAQTQRYVLWIYKELEGENAEVQAGTIAKLTGSIRADHAVCSEQTIGVAEEVYLSLAHPDGEMPQQVTSYLLQGVRRHILHQFLHGLKALYPTWAINPEERHLVNQLLSIINQKGMHLGLPEEKIACKDRYYSGSMVEALLWFEARKFKEFFLEKYTAEEILSATKVSDWEGTFKDKFNAWVAPPQIRNDLTASVLRRVERSTCTDGRLIDKNRYALLVHMGVLTVPKGAVSQLQENGVS